MNLSIEFLNAFPVQAIGWTVLHTLWIGMAIWLIFILGRSIIGKNSSLQYYFAYTMQMLLFLSFTAVLSYEYFQFSNQVDKAKVTEILTVSNLNAVFTVDNTHANGSLFESEILPIINNLTPFLAFIWILGALIMVFRFVTNLFYVQNLRTTGISPIPDSWNELFARLKDEIGIRKGVEFLESSLINSPLTIGHLKPMVLIPTGILASMPAEQVEAIILHELAHIKRADYLLNIIQNVVESLIFFHPVTWILSESIRRERENICDDFSVNSIENPMHLAKALFEIQKRNALVPDLALGAGNGKLLNRINRIFDKDAQNKRTYYGILPALLLIAILLITPAFNMKTNIKEDSIITDTPPSNTDEAPIKPTDEKSEVKKQDEKREEKTSTKTYSSSMSFTSTNSDDQEIKLKTTTESGDKIDIVFSSPDDIKKLKINGKKIAEADYDKYRKMLDKEVFSQINTVSKESSYTYVISTDDADIKSGSNSFVIKVDDAELENSGKKIIINSSDGDSEVITMDLSSLEGLEEISEMIEVEIENAADEMEKAMREIRVHVNSDGNDEDAEVQVIHLEEIDEEMAAMTKALKETMQWLDEESDRLERFLDQEEMEKARERFEEVQEQLMEQMENLEQTQSMKTIKVQMDKMQEEERKMKEEIIVMQKEAKQMAKEKAKIKEEIILIEKDAKVIRIEAEALEAKCKDVVEALKKDGLIDKQANKVSLEFKSGKMKIDGKKADEKYQQKYMEMLDINEDAKVNYEYRFDNEKDIDIDIEFEEKEESED